MEDEFKDPKNFTFIWILENFEYCGQKAKDLLSSPTFIVDTIERSKWSLLIYPRGSDSDIWISLYLHREADSKGPATIVVDYELAFLASDGSVLKSEKILKHAFPKDYGYGFEEFEEREYVFANRSLYLPQSALTIRCKIWKCAGEVQRNGQCVARSRIGVDKKAFLWKIQNFSTLDAGEIKLFSLKSTSDDKPIMTLKLYLNKWSRWSNIFIEFVRSNKNVIFSTFKCSLIDAKGEFVNCCEKELWLTPSTQSEIVALSFTKRQLIDNNSLYLPNDVLTLYCELAFSTGIALEVIEGTSYGCSGTFITSNIFPENTKTENIMKSGSEISSALKLDLSYMLKDNILCDVKLCVKAETFPAHWFILSARSPVFRAMFQSDMKERAKERIYIEDLKPDTVRRMLHYMYTDSLDDLQWETAFDLYVAADKYQIMTLKGKCSSFLKTNLSLTNACRILLLADLHQDKELKSMVQVFILENDKSIINSSEWKLLMQTNVHLAAETMVLRFKE